MVLLENAVAGWLTIFSLLLAALAVLAFRRSGNARMLGIAAAFGLFFAKGLLVTYALFALVRLDTLWLPMAALDTAALLAFYLSAIRS